MIGAIVGQRYRIVRDIGKGGMGAVYEGEDTITGARVAVKIITAEAAKDPTLMGRFEREARATSALATPHIVRTLDAGLDAATELPFLVMELLEGEDVQHLIRRTGPLRPDLALRVVAQACLGLDRAHEARIIHRDIKPANFFLAKTTSPGAQRVVKLLDFGIAKITHEPDDRESSAGLTRTGSMLGSPLYMSPEQARGYKGIDRRSDVWSLGVVLYQSLAGRTPHQDTDALGDLIIAICTEPPPPLQEVAPWVSPDVAAIVHKAMRSKPEERYQSAGEMLDALRPLLPEGWSIDESMLRPLDEGERAAVAPRLQAAADVPFTTRSGRTGSQPLSSSLPPPPAPAQTAHLDSRSPDTVSPAPAPANGAMEGFGTTVAGASPRRARDIALAAAAVAVLAGGAIIYRLTHLATAAPANSAPPAVTAAPTHAPTSAPDDTRPRTVKLVILPAEATVEVDGERAAITDGTVEIKGLIGSVHKVRLTTPAGEVTREVVVSESGAVPAKIEAPAPPAPKGEKPRPLPLKPSGPRAPSAPSVPGDLRPQR